MTAPIKTTVRVTDRDRGWRKLSRIIFRRQPHTTVGVHGDQSFRSQGEIGNVALMTIHEFGSAAANIPERSVIRHTIDTNENRYRKLASKLGGQVYQLKMTVPQALEILGLKVASDMRRTIAKTPGSWDSLKPATIAARDNGGTKPLLDRGEMQKAIQHKVVR